MSMILGILLGAISFRSDGWVGVTASAIGVAIIAALNHIYGLSDHGHALGAMLFDYLHQI